MGKTARAHTNIALVKYWGKRDQNLIIPQTDSLSLTLDRFYTDTTVDFNSAYNHDQLIINDTVIPRNQMSKAELVLNRVRELSGKNLAAKIVSTSHVPISAGLASSASAFAALATAAAAAANLDLSKRDLSRLARIGSGSATRSIFGGFVQWHRGSDDLTSYAEPIMENVDFGIEMIAILINTKEKKISSRGGMQQSVATSPYYDSWRKVVAADMVAIKKAIANKDINEIGHIAETNAMRMHALTLSSDPSFTYFNAETINTINLLNNLHNDGLNCYYTMDAGPNVKVIYDAVDREKILEKLIPVFGKDHLVVAKPGPGVSLLN